MKYKVSLEIVEKLIRIGIYLGQNYPKQNTNELIDIFMKEFFNQLDKEKLE